MSALHPPSGANAPAPGGNVELARLCAAVQTNCHIADARHAADLTLCIYLLQMREFHRWERGLPFCAALARDAVGAWIAEREALWDTLEGQDFVALPLGDGEAPVDPFDVATVNARLQPAGLLYGAGLLAAQRPVFFLAERHAHAQRGAVQVHSAGRELARGLAAPPATSGGFGGADTIVVRRDALARWCWEKFEAFALRPRADAPFQAVVRAHGLDTDFDAALPRWLDEQSEAMVLHELGELRAGAWLGEAWTALRVSLPTRRGELYARALRDHLADLAVTLPTLLERGAATSIHFWFANYDGVRELLFPELNAAYVAWCGGDGGLALQRCATHGHAHFARLAEACLDLHRRQGAHAGTAIEALLTASAAVCAAPQGPHPRA